MMNNISGPVSASDKPGPADARGPMNPGFRILEFAPVVKGALRGFAKIALPSGMIISDVMLLESHGKFWASPPAKPSLTREGAHMRGASGKGQYTPIITFVTKDRRDAFSAMVVAALREQRPEAFQQ